MSDREPTPTLARVLSATLQLAGMRAWIIGGCWLTGTSREETQRIMRLRGLATTSKADGDVRDTTLWMIACALFRRERARWRLRWAEFRLQIAEARRRRRRQRRGNPSAR
jgi:hypothetical protein